MIAGMRSGVIFLISVLADAYVNDSSAQLFPFSGIFINQVLSFTLSRVSFDPSFCIL